jgi:hypothetical protein
LREKTGVKYQAFTRDINLIGKRKRRMEMSDCGRIICCHNGLCFNCMLEKVKTKKSLSLERLKNMEVIHQLIPLAFWQIILHFLSRLA